MAESPCHLFWGSRALSAKAAATVPKAAGPSEDPFLTDGMVSDNTRKQVLAEGKGLCMGEEVSELSVGYDGVRAQAAGSWV